MAFTESDLNIGQQEIDDLKSALANNGVPNLFTNILAEQETKVRDWTSRFVVPEGTLKRLWRSLALYEAGTLAGLLSDPREKAYKDAMEELTAIRDGKFPQYAPASPQPAGFTTNPGKWGSAPKVPARL